MGFSISVCCYGRYIKMLDKAASENIITEKLYLYEHFFVNTKESKANITANRLPYFDGDYISIKAEEILMELEREEAEEIQKGKERSKIGTAVKRSKDADLMKRVIYSPKCIHDCICEQFLLSSVLFNLVMQLGKLVRHQKNYILVHLQHICRHCCEFISSGSCWSCKDCKDFIICDM